MTAGRPLLIVEDDDVDAMIAKRCLKELGIVNPLVHKRNGEEALVYLRDCLLGRPLVILLDLNMPRMNGMEFLGALHASEALRDIPVVMVSTSNASQDMARSFELGAAGYIVKSVDYREFQEGMRAVKNYVSQTPATAEVRGRT
jgi:CheY-like chemotaxis protein